MIKPVNRYVQIATTRTTPEDNAAGILLPADFKPAETRHRMASVVSWADDVRFANDLKVGTRIIIDNSMAQLIDADNGQINVIQDNYVIAILND